MMSTGWEDERLGRLRLRGMRLEGATGEGNQATRRLPVKDGSAPRKEQDRGGKRA